MRKLILVRDVVIAHLGVLTRRPDARHSLNGKIFIGSVHSEFRVCGLIRLDEQ